MGTHKHNNHKAYFILMSLEVGLIGIKYQGLNTNPFQQSSPTVFLCLISLFCHTVTTMADMNFSVTIVLFHFSGVVGCETLLWIILPVFWKWYIINLFLFLVTSFCFFNTIRTIPKLFLPTHSTAAQPPNPQESSQPVQQSSSNIIIMHLFFLYPWQDDSFCWSRSIQFQFLANRMVMRLQWEFSWVCSAVKQM